MSDDKNEDLEQQAVNNNPCDTCRKKGLAKCLCKGGGGGGGEESPDETDTERKAADPMENQPTLEALNDTFVESPLWVPVEDEDDMYTYQDPEALFTATLDLSAGSLVLNMREGLSTEDKTEAKALMSQFIDKFNAFKAELACEGIDTTFYRYQQKDGTLTIKIPHKEHFDRFVQQLVDEKLLPTRVMQQAQKSGSDAPDQNEAAASSKNITPFNTDCTPGE